MRNTMNQQFKINRSKNNKLIDAVGLQSTHCEYTAKETKFIKSLREEKTANTILICFHEIINIL